ncbi:hypothetical protein LQ327_31935 [Actinomycetospora endophytica]|uniref:ABC-type branched-subunit amino acid transport system substrate-binding protein n=1 Tax=Actinomycetospora endophytica TaxID=2291215 RepID=A0ABS8PIA3_9PSEU|nr:hypothetical protein [Actinomycetospora endophytica]MCD2197991.1 hypothetical protein [Actinomycetospora endophytica]
MVTSSSTTAAPPPKASTHPDPSSDGSGWAGPPAGRRGALLIAGALALATVIGLVVLITTGVTETPDAVPALLSFIAPEVSPASVVVRIVLVVASSLAAGLGLARGVMGPGANSATAALRGAAVVAGAAVVVAGVLGDAGWPAVAGHVLLVVGVAALPRRTASAAAVLLAATVALEVAVVRWGPAAVVELLVTVVLTVALGAAAVAAVRSDDAVAARRATVLGAAASLVGAGVGVAVLAIDGAAPVDLLRSVRGIVALALVALPLVAAALLAPSLRTSPTADDDTVTRRARQWHELARWSAGALVVALGGVALLGALPGAPQGPQGGRALLRPVTLGTEREAVLVAPTAGGRTLVRLSDGSDPDPAHASSGMDMGGMDMGGMGGMSTPPPPDLSRYTVSAGGTPVLFGTRAGAPGRWAVVDVPAGSDELTLTGPQGSATVPVATGSSAADGATLAGPDGPECADAQFGDLLGGGSGVACPSSALSPADARTVTAAVSDLHSRGLRSLYLVGDDSARSRAAVAAVRDTAARVGLAISDAPHPEDGLLVLSGWESAHATLTDVTAAATRAPTFAGGQFLAPWLLTPGVLSAGSSTMFPLSFTPQDATPRGYAALLTTITGDAAPSYAGYLAWAHAHGLPDGPNRLYAAAAIDVMPGMPGMSGGDRAGAWFPGGGIVPLSGPLS